MSRSISERRVATLAAALLATALIAACDLGTVTIPTTDAALVVHSVLNPNFAQQVVLVERTLTGQVTIPDTGFSASDPIVTAGGIAVSGATVEIIDSLGRVFRGVEDVTLPVNNGRGAGVYKVPLSGTQIILGGRYKLHVRTIAGEELTAFTRVPRALTRSSGALSRSFNRDHDTLIVNWAGVPAARNYSVRVESPFGPFYLFTDSTRVRITGDLRNLFANSLQRVFIPGFRQDVVVAAVDSNFYDYYRTNNDPFTGAGIISRVTGGLGMFGSIVELTTGTFSVVADQHGGIEGRFVVVDPTRTLTVTQITLYKESAPARAGLPAALSGRYSGTGIASDGILGQLFDSTFTLSMVRNQLAGDTALVFAGVLRRDTLVGAYRGNVNRAIYVRSP